MTGARRVGDTREYRRLLETGAFNDPRIWPILLTQRHGDRREPALYVGPWRRSSVCSSRRKKPLARCSRDELREAIDEQRGSLAFAVQQAEECRLQLETLEALDASFDAPTLRLVEGDAA
jgi:hypothetical protein